MRWLMMVAVVSLLTVEARAENPPSPASLTTPTTATSTISSQDSWYGWEMLLFDVPSIGGMIYGLFNADWNILGMSALHYVVATPMVHFAHSKSSQGWNSMGGRLLSPLLFGYLGIRLGCTELASREQCAAVAWSGIGLGVLLPVLHDQLDAWETVPVMPVVSASHHGATFGIAGAF